MKTKLILILSALIITNSSNAQLSLSVSPGLNMNGAHLGYKFADRFVPFIGCRYFRASYNYTYSGKEYSSTVPNLLMDIEYTDEIAANFILPTLGLKTFLISKNKLKAFVSLSASKPILTGKYVEDGVEDPQIKEDLKSLKLFAGETSFGMEYFFDDNFSVGGEFGLRYFNVKSSRTHDGSIYNPNTGLYEASSHEHSYRAAFSPTFSKISLNFYL